MILRNLVNEDSVFHPDIATHHLAATLVRVHLPVRNFGSHLFQYFAI
jgi:hypothetical protein